MKKTIRKVLSLVLALALVFSLAARRCASSALRPAALRPPAPNPRHHAEGLHLVGRDEVKHLQKISGF